MTVVERLLLNQANEFFHFWTQLSEEVTYKMGLGFHQIPILQLLRSTKRSNFDLIHNGILF